MRRLSLIHYLAGMAFWLSLPVSTPFCNLRAQEVKSPSVWKQNNLGTAYTASPRMRVIIDNDFSGDPDGLVQLAHHLLSPSVEVRGIIGSHLTPLAGGTSHQTAREACNRVHELLEVMGMEGNFRVCEGSNRGLDSLTVATVSEGARLIVQEAMRQDTDVPLYVVCGASLTSIATAWLMCPEIEEHLTLVWIGGQEYDGLGVPPPGYSMPEYNLGLCIPSAQVVFNRSRIPLWQVPRDAYRQCIYSLAELEEEMMPCGGLGHYLYNILAGVMQRLGGYGKAMGEVYVLGDSPLVLLTALQTGFEPDPASSHYQIRQAPVIADDGSYRYNPVGRNIRVYYRIDVRLLWGDLVGKLKRYTRQKK